MPRGNPNIWKKHGASYAELSGTSTSIERAQDVAPRRLPPVSPASLAEARDTKPAGVPSLKPHKGVGSFVLQSNWSLGVPPCGTAAAVHSGRSSSSSSSSGRGGGGDSAGLGPSSAAAAAAAQPAPTSRWAAVSAAAGGGPLTAGLPPRTYNTETKSNFGPPPSDFRRTVRVLNCSISQDSSGKTGRR
ncbi:hypothetical protein Vretimale_8784 [Volvox reticuliferus]|uniref:Uncharacterized protein n=1 Tax=Volvox reticuliferus TaxID=1737510 RepID=A0A8J4GBI7_9CHLO|nr:hypothetical protein Vretimale_8784 [Volvox reticuliferus]